MRTINAIEHSDVCVLMIDATQGDIESQDLNIIHLIVKIIKDFVIVVNKWDLIVDKQTMTTKYFEEKLEKVWRLLETFQLFFICYRKTTHHESN